MLDKLAGLLDRLRTVKDVLAWLPTVREVLPHARLAYERAAAGDLPGAKDAAVAAVKLVLPAGYLALIDAADGAFDANYRLYTVTRATFFEGTPVTPADGTVLVGLAGFDAGPGGRRV
jgi:hypothetical protein